MKRKIGILVMLIAVAVAATSCGNKEKKPPYEIGGNVKSTISIPYEEYGGVKMIPVKLNGVTMNMIYDTGCSGLHISLHEFEVLCEQGKIEPDDIMDDKYMTIADGSRVAIGQVRIKLIEIGEGEGRLPVENKVASVSLNQVAPILLGNAVLDELASVEVDNLKKTINFKKK